MDDINTRVEDLGKRKEVKLEDIQIHRGEAYLHVSYSVF